MSDPARLIADAIIAFVADPARDYSLQFTAERPKQPGKALKAEHAGYRLIAFPVGEVEEKESRNRVNLQPQVNIVLTGPVEGEADYDAATDLMYEIRNSLRHVAMAGWTWLRTETIAKYDPDQLAKERYLSAVTLTYAGIE